MLSYNKETSQHEHLLQGCLLQAECEDFLRIFLRFVIVYDRSVCHFHLRQLRMDLTTCHFGCWQCRSTKKGVSSPLHHPLNHSDSRCRSSSKRKTCGGGRSPRSRQSIEMHAVAHVAFDKEVNRGSSVAGTHTKLRHLRFYSCQGHRRLRTMFRMVVDWSREWEKSTKPLGDVCICCHHSRI